MYGRMKRGTRKTAAAAVLCLCMFQADRIAAAPAAPPRGLSTIEVPASPQGSVDRRTIPVDVYMPVSGRHAGDILVLPGWKFPRREWQSKSPIISEAERLGFRCVFPEMNTTLYESSYYPETAMKWSAMPGGRWIRERLLPALREIGLFRNSGKNFIMGLSTGGRGAVLVTLQNPGVFRAAAALSGDFDQSAMPRDRLMTSVYGPFRKFRERWEGADNPQKNIGRWNIPLYLGHGKKDEVVPFSQSESFYSALKKMYPALDMVFNAPEKAGHDFNYWSSEVKPVMDFFASMH